MPARPDGSPEPPVHAGSCLCGTVTFTVTGPLPPPDICHCRMCRKQSGHCFASTDVAKAALRIADPAAVTWFQSSEKIRRGFCGKCGSTLFWDPAHRDWTAVAMGAFDGATGTTAHRHIFVADKGDYYAIADDLPQRE